MAGATSSFDDTSDTSWLYKAGQMFQRASQYNDVEEAQTRAALAYPFKQFSAGYSGVAPGSADAIIAGSQGRIDAARTTAIADDATRGALPSSPYGMYDRGAGSATPTAGAPNMDSLMKADLYHRYAGGYAPSAAEEAQQQATQADTYRQQQQAVQSAWLKQQGIPGYAITGTPDTAGLPQRARPGSTTEGDYSGFAAPGTRIFGTADKTGRVNSFTGASLPTYGGAGGGGGGAGTDSQRIASTIMGMSQRLALLGRSGNVNDLLERRELLRNMEALSKVHATLSQHEIGQMQVGEQTRSSKQRERATSAAQSSVLPALQKQMIELQAMGDPDTYRALMAAERGGYAQPKVQAYSPLGMFAPGMGGMPTYYGAPEMGANIGATNIYPQ